MTMLARMLARMKSGVILRAILLRFSSAGRLINCWIARTGETSVGLSQRVARKAVRSAAWAPSRASEKGLDKNVCSPTKRQLTVHLNKNWRESSKARER